DHALALGRRVADAAGLDGVRPRRNVGDHVAAVLVGDRAVPGAAHDDLHAGDRPARRRVRDRAEDPPGLLLPAPHQPERAGPRHHRLDVRALERLGQDVLYGEVRAADGDPLVHRDDPAGVLQPDRRLTLERVEERLERHVPHVERDPPEQRGLVPLRRFTAPTPDPGSRGRPERQDGRLLRPEGAAGKEQEEQSERRSPDPRCSHQWLLHHSAIRVADGSRGHGYGSSRNRILRPSRVCRTSSNWSSASRTAWRGSSPNVAVTATSASAAGYSISTSYQRPSSAATRENGCRWNSSRPSAQATRPETSTLSSTSSRPSTTRAASPRPSRNSPVSPSDSNGRSATWPSTTTTSVTPGSSRSAWTRNVVPRTSVSAPWVRTRNRRPGSRSTLKSASPSSCTVQREHPGRLATHTRLSGARTTVEPSGRRSVARCARFVAYSWTTSGSRPSPARWRWIHRKAAGPMARASTAASRRNAARRRGSRASTRRRAPTLRPPPARAATRSSASSARAGNR